MEAKTGTGNLPPHPVATLFSSLGLPKETKGAAADNGDEKIAVTGKEEEVTNFKVGDHIYSWLADTGIPFPTHLGIPGISHAAQEHGIVLVSEADSLTLMLFRKKENGEKKKATKTAENTDCTSHTFHMVKENVSLKEARQTWHQIPYGVHWKDRLFSRAGTANPNKADPGKLTLQRINFLWDNQSSLLLDLAKATTPKEDVSECIAVWCKTGSFHSFHGLAKMGHHGADAGSSATLVGGIATQLIASAFVPILLPVFAVYDVAVAFKTFKDTHACQEEWSDISQNWNGHFLLTKQRRKGQWISIVASLHSKKNEKREGLDS
jgi:hypothetical protein